MKVGSQALSAQGRWKPEKGAVLEPGRDAWIEWESDVEDGGLVGLWIGLRFAAQLLRV